MLVLVSLSVDINECASHPCKNGGTCSDLVNGYKCSCKPGYTGINCQTGVYMDKVLFINLVFNGYIYI